MPHVLWVIMLPMSGEEKISVFVFSHPKVKKVFSFQKKLGTFPFILAGAEHWRQHKI